MEISSIVPIKTVAFPGGAASLIDSNESQKVKSVKFGLKRGIIGGRGLCGRRCSVKAVSPVLDDGFREKGHLEYYGEDKKKSLKKKLKILKDLAKGFNVFDNLESCAGVVNSPSNESKELLLKQLEQLKVEEKAMKKRRKQEKARLKANKRNTKMGCDSSSESSSSSSDGECRDVVNLRSMRSKVLEQPIQQVIETVTKDPVQPLVEGATPMLKEFLVTPQKALPSVDSGFPIQAESIMKDSVLEGCTSAVCTPSSSVVRLTGQKQKKIEVCMGGKCKKSGAALLLEGFGRAMGEEGGVVGCKCMGKCKNGPNVRVSSNGAGAMDDSARTPANSLYMGVSLDDIGVIMSSLSGEDGNDMRPY